MGGRKPWTDRFLTGISWTASLRLTRQAWWPRGISNVPASITTIIFSSNATGVSPCSSHYGLLVAHSIAAWGCVGDRSIGTLPIDYFLGRLVVCAQCVDLCTMYRGWDVYKPLCVETQRPSLLRLGLCDQVYECCYCNVLHTL